MDFGEALKAMKMGNRVSREAWRGTIAYYVIDEEPHTHADVIRCFRPDGTDVIISGIEAGDILADDWWIVI